MQTPEDSLLIANHFPFFNRIHDHANLLICVCSDARKHKDSPDTSRLSSAPNCPMTGEDGPRDALAEKIQQLPDSIQAAQIG